MYGPPGCGKTLVVRKVATDSKLPLIYIDAPQIIGYYYYYSFFPSLFFLFCCLMLILNSEYIGESEENIRKEFANAEELASLHGACILFIDEIVCSLFHLFSFLFLFSTLFSLLFIFSLSFLFYFLFFFSRFFLSLFLSSFPFF